MRKREWKRIEKGKNNLKRKRNVCIAIEKSRQWERSVERIWWGKSVRERKKCEQNGWVMRIKNQWEQKWMKIEKKNSTRN